MGRFKPFSLLAAPILILSSFAFADTVTSPTTGAPADTVAVLKTKMALRDLWVEHIFWIRSFVLATHAGDEAQRKVAETQIVANARALADAVTPFYGQPAADSLFKLLAGHWGAVREYSTATAAHSRSAQDKAVQGLTENAREIARFLSGANPYLPENTVFALLAAHGAHHVAQINQIAAGDFPDEARTWQTMRGHMLVIADAITDGLARQFPGKF